MNLEPTQFDRIQKLCGAVRDGDTSAKMIAEIENLLAADAESRKYYAYFMLMHALMERYNWVASGENFRSVQLDFSFIQGNRPSDCGRNGDFEMPNNVPVIVQCPSTGVSDAPLIAIQQLSSPPPLGFLSTAYHGTANFFSQEIPFACLMSTLFMIVGGIIGLFITKEHYTQMPGRSASSAERSYAATDAPDRPAASTEQEKALVFVGRITGMVDCRWADPGRTFSSSTDYSVALHDKYSLTSGLMEITYYSGAKVILQGPCTYEVDSAAGGYLSLGKLTARVEKKGAGKAVASGQWPVASESTGRASGTLAEGEKVQGSRSKVQDSDSSSLNLEPLALNLPSNPQIPKSPNPSSPAPRPPSPAPLFAVRTPTAVVIDLGTEFGVEVNDRGFTDAHVFRGKVSMVVIAADGETQGGEIMLGENESASVGAERKSISRIAPDSHRFVRDVRRYTAQKIISVNFTDGGLSLLEPDEKAGVLPAGHWNNVDVSPNPAPVVSLHNSAGEATTAKLSWEWTGNTHPWTSTHNFGQPQGSFEKLMNGRFRGSADSVAPKLTIRVRDVPYKNYRVYAYYWQMPAAYLGVPSDKIQGCKHKFNLSLNGGKPICIARPVVYLNGFYRYRSEAESGDYQIFEGLSGDLAVDAMAGESEPNSLVGITYEIFITGMQIAETSAATANETKPTENGQRKEVADKQPG